MEASLSRYWSDIVHRLTPYVPGEQPALAHPAKLNTNENPYPPSPRVLEAIRHELGDSAESLRRYPDPTARKLRETVAAHHGIRAEQVFAGNGSDEVLALTFQALLKHDKPILFPDITYSFYPTYAGLFEVEYRTVPVVTRSPSASTTTICPTAASCCRIRMRRLATLCRSAKSSGWWHGIPTRLW
jgi:histidinol-phosphate aminotransferase